MNSEIAKLRSLVRSAVRSAPEAVFAIGAVAQYLGAGIAVQLFDHIPAGAVAWLRVASAGVLLVLIRRSWRRHWSKADLGWTAAFGAALAAMNLFFYLAIDRIALGNSVAIEFVGPIAVAALGTRTRQSVLALTLAVCGVVLLGGFGPPEAQLGSLFSLIAGCLWAGYIVFGHRVARSGTATHGLGLGMVIGALVILPAGVGGLGELAVSPWLLAGGVAAGVLSNVVPYGIDQLIMGQIERPRFALLQAMLPATATIIGLLWLAQIPSLRELAGILLVVVAILINREPRARIT